MPGQKDVVELLADEVHSRWARWQKYLHSKCIRQSMSDQVGACLIIPAPLVQRWERQIATSYQDLSELEKESDREQARNVVAALSALPKSYEPIEVWAEASVPKLREDIKLHLGMYLEEGNGETVDTLTHLILTSLRCRLGNNVFEVE